jgi:hypothetical protein
MAEVRYIFGDVLTGNIIAEIDCQGVTINESLAGGDWRGTIHLDRTGRSNDVLTSATVPGRCYVVTERDGTIVGDHIMWTRTYQSQAKSVQLYGRSWKNYVGHRLITVNRAFTEQDQLDIFLDLFELLQSEGSSIPITLPSSLGTSGVLRTLEILGSELKSYEQVFDSLADGDDGFDWVVDTSRLGGVYARTLRVGYPSIGAKDPLATVFEYQAPTEGVDDGGGNIFNYWSNESMGSTGSHIFAVGGGEGDATIIESVVHGDLIAGGFPRYDVTTSHKDIADRPTLAAIARADAAVLKAGAPTLTVQLKADKEPVFGGFGLGDMARVEIRDPRFPNGFTKSTRILGWTYTPPSSDGVEQVQLVFEGDEL